MHTVAAPAKLNLSLHITGKRADGYHALESLVVFTALHDELRVTEANGLSLSVSGPFANVSGDAEANLVMKAARALQAATGCRKGAAITLVKHIPVGAGLGGGSADAAMALQVLRALWGVDADLPALAATLGADVPMFLHAPQPLMVRGIGEVIAPLAVKLPELHAVLVYPNRPLSTIAVYQAYRHETRAPLALAETSGEAVLQSLKHARNDLQRPAISLMPEVAEVLLALETIAPKPELVRMSGSGACCFALYRDSAQAEACAEALRVRYPHWWVQVSAIS